MDIKLNNIVEPYNEFYGRVTKQMPRLVAEGRTPASVADVLERRLHSDLQDWENNYFFTGDAIAYHPDKKFKIVLDAELLRNLTSKSDVSKGTLVLPDGLYESLQSEEFLYKDVKNLLGEELFQKEILQHPLWKAVARDQALLEEYVPKMFAEMKERWNYKENMGVYLDSLGVESPKLRALVVNGFVDGSGLDGRNYLDFENCRLVGVAPEALNAHGKVIVKPSLETALSVVNEHLGKGLVLRTK